MIACLLATLFTLHYLITTTYGYMGYGDSLITYVIGSNHNFDEFASEALFVSMMRFFLVFGFTWFPVTSIVATMKR